MAASAWICWARPVESWLDSILSIQNNGDYFPESWYRKTFPQTAPNWWSVSSLVEWWRLGGIRPLLLVPIYSMKSLRTLLNTDVVPATTPPMPKSEQNLWDKYEIIKKVRSSLFIPFHDSEEGIYILSWVPTVGV